MYKAKQDIPSKEKNFKKGETYSESEILTALGTVSSDYFKKLPTEAEEKEQQEFLFKILMGFVSLSILGLFLFNTLLTYDTNSKISGCIVSPLGR